MKSHLKRLVIPKSWTLLKKEEKFVVRPRPGAHPAKLSMPITLLFKSLGYASTTAEVKKILNTKEVLVDGKRVKEHKFPVGLMDVITIKDTNDALRIVLDKKGRLKVVPADKEETQLKLCRVKKKTALKKGKIQLNLSDNRNILTDKSAVKAGDSVLITVPFQEIKEHLPLENGAVIYLIGGKRIGHKGTVDSIEGNKLIYSEARKKHESLKKYAFVIGKGKEAIKLE
ncbi:30S ribosomal protein S4e [Candidatus Woesearchaeota archaeon]|nr:30S ribosomal protein S4e [Candidatus Woesearchaeota archaeon]MBW3006062.1 30S ribosomal protein S4e [Candidatus Woesearchaeota archaeon]